MGRAKMPTRQAAKISTDKPSQARGGERGRWSKKGRYMGAAVDGRGAARASVPIVPGPGARETPQRWLGKQLLMIACEIVASSQVLPSSSAPGAQAIINNCFPSQ